jgi:hypothetical protein
MTMGMRVWNSSGQLIVDSDSGLTRFSSAGTTSSVAASGGTLFVPVSGMVDDDTWQVFIYLTPSTTPAFGDFSIAKGAGGFTITNNEAVSRTYDYQVVRA